MKGLGGRGWARPAAKNHLRLGRGAQAFPGRVVGVAYFSSAGSRRRRGSASCSSRRGTRRICRASRCSTAGTLTPTLAAAAAAGSGRRARGWYIIQAGSTACWAPRRRRQQWRRQPSRITRDAKGWGSSGRKERGRLAAGGWRQGRPVRGCQCGGLRAHRAPPRTTPSTERARVRTGHEADHRKGTRAYRPRGRPHKGHACVPVTRQNTLSTSSCWMYVRMCWWCRLFSTDASRSMPCTWLAFTTVFMSISLRATCAPVFRLVAFITSPNPPSPSLPWIMNSPTRLRSFSRLIVARGDGVARGPAGSPPAQRACSYTRTRTRMTTRARRVPKPPHAMPLGTRWQSSSTAKRWRTNGAASRHAARPRPAPRQRARCVKSF